MIGLPPVLTFLGPPAVSDRANHPRNRRSARLAGDRSALVKRGGPVRTSAMARLERRLSRSQASLLRTDFLEKPALKPVEARRWFS